MSNYIARMFYVGLALFGLACAPKSSTPILTPEQCASKARDLAFKLSEELVKASTLEDTAEVVIGTREVTKELDRAKRLAEAKWGKESGLGKLEENRDYAAAQGYLVEVFRQAHMSYQKAENIRD